MEAELGKDLCPEIARAIKKATLDLANDIDRLQKTNARLKKAIADLETLGRGNLPHDVRKVSMPFETVHLDRCRVPEDETIAVFIPAGTTMREKKQLIHLTLTQALRSIDRDIIDLQREDLRNSTTKSVFVAQCMAANSTQDEQWNDLDLKIEDEDVRGMSADVLEAKCIIIYQRTVAKAVEKKKQESIQFDKLSKSRDSKLQEVLKKPPQDHLLDAIDNRIALKMKGKKITNTVDHAGLFLKTIDRTMAVDLEASDIAPFVPSPKNGRAPKSSPSAGGGKGRGKGKGDKEGTKGKAKGKGKGKDLAWDPKKPKPTSWPTQPTQQAQKGLKGPKGGKGFVKGGDKGKGKGKGKKK